MDLLLLDFRFDMFDHRFFGITETEADLMDPQQKLLLHCTYRTLEDAGISMESFSGSKTGVYIGNCHHPGSVSRCVNYRILWHLL